MITKVVNVTLSIILLCWILYTTLFIYYILDSYIANPFGHWSVLDNLCCDYIKKIPIYIHCIGGVSLMILGPLQILNMYYPIKIHKYLGYMYIASCLMACIGGWSFIGFNSTVGGFWMSFPFAIYGLLISAYPLTTWYYIRKNDVINHRRWALRTFLLGNGSLLYRTFYEVMCDIMIQCGIITFNEPIDYVFNWLFFLVPMILSEIYLFFNTI